MFQHAIHASTRFALAALVSVAGIAATAIPVEPVQAAKAASHKPFTLKAFRAAQAANKPILIDVYAPWCPTCRAQQPGIAAAQNLKSNSGLVVFRMDFDNQKTLLRQFRVSKQATLIAYRGKKETGRSLGVTNRAAIAKLIATTR